MTYKGKSIKSVSVKMIEEYVKKKKYDLDAKKIFDICSARKWKNHQGNNYKRLEKLIDSFYSNPIKRENAKVNTSKIVEKENSIKKPFIPYSKQLLDVRWERFRRMVFMKRGKRCEDCWATKFLNIHHLEYRGECYAWEYSIDDVVVVCKSCHKKRHGLYLDELFNIAVDRENT